MGFAVEMYFDRKMEAALRGLRAILTRRGIPPVLDELGDRPHISLCVVSQLEAGAFQPHLKRFASQYSIFPVRLDGVASFPEALFLKPEKSPALLAIHSDFHRLLAKLNIRSGEYYVPENWVPHCTMAQDVDAKALAHAVEASRNFPAIEGTIHELGLVQFPPVSSLYAFPLAGGELLAG